VLGLGIVVGWLACGSAAAAPFDGTRCPLRPAATVTVLRAVVAGRSVQMRVPSRIQVPAGVQQWTVPVIGAPLSASATFSLDGKLAHASPAASSWGARQPSFVWRTLNTMYPPGRHEIQVRVRSAAGADAVLTGRFRASRCPSSTFFAQASRLTRAHAEMSFDSVQAGGIGPRIVDASVRVLHGATLRLPAEAPGRVVGTIEIITPGRAYRTYALRAPRDRRTLFARRGTRVTLDRRRDTVRIAGLPAGSRGAVLRFDDADILRAARPCAPVSFRATLRGERGRPVRLGDVDASPRCRR
jgi:hypothetical protein